MCDGDMHITITHNMHITFIFLYFFRWTEYKSHMLISLIIGDSIKNEDALNTILLILIFILILIVGFISFKESNDNKIDLDIPLL